MATPTKQQLNAALTALFAVAETVRELGSIPSSTLYAQLMHSMSFEGYESMLGTLQRAELITVENHVIRWVGPSHIQAVS